MRSNRDLFVLGLVVLGTGCGGGPLFYAELEEPAICKTVLDVPMDATAPGASLSKTIPIDLASNVPLFDTSNGAVVRLLEVKFTGKQGIQDFNSVENAEILAVPDPANTSGLQPTLVLSYAKAPGVTPGRELNIAADQGVDLVPFLTNGVVTVEARMNGGLPNNVWTADVRGCIYMMTRVAYLDAYGLPF